MYNVFVYGTLKRGFHNHVFLENAQYLGEGILHDYGVFNMNVGFPGIKHSEGRYVVGEVYRVTQHELKDLDRLEGFYGYDNVASNMYNRIKGTVKMVTGESIVVDTYEWNNKKPPTEDYIHNGRWEKAKIRIRRW